MQLFDKLAFKRMRTRYRSHLNNWRINKQFKSRPTHILNNPGNHLRRPTPIYNNTFFKVRSFKCHRFRWLKPEACRLPYPELWALLYSPDLEYANVFGPVWDWQQNAGVGLTSQPQAAEAASAPAVGQKRRRGPGSKKQAPKATAKRPSRGNAGTPRQVSRLDTESEAEGSSGHDSDAPQRIKMSSSDEGSDAPRAMRGAGGA